MKNRYLNGFIIGASAVAVVVALSLAVFAATSGVCNNVICIGPRASYSTPQDADEGQWFSGFQARLHVTPVVALEGSIDYRRNDFGNTTRIKTYPLQASVLAYLTPGASWSPFLLGGGGWYYTEVDGPNDYRNTSSRFGLHAGAGIEFMLNDYLSIDGTYRYVWLDSVVSRDAALQDKTFQDSGSMVTIGLNFLF